jgi:PhzF family phenazine biosynthesis protein
VRPFAQVDVFSPQPLRGNPVAVVLDGGGLSEEQMLRFTRWTNLSEATFVLPPTDPMADYRVRIFTAAGEVGFAGHPTLGTCHAWLGVGGRPRDPDRIVQECPAGFVPLRRIDGRLAFEAPALLRSEPLAAAELARVAAILRLDPAEILASRRLDNGIDWLVVLIDAADAVLAIEPTLPEGWDGRMLSIGVLGRYPDGSECAFELRALFADDRGRLMEDPVTGGLNASLGQWMVETGQVAAPYVVGQGTALGRTGRAHISQDVDGSIWVAGDTFTLVEGSIELP